MGTNLHLLLLLCATQPCPPEAGELVAQGWVAYRADSIVVAAERFTHADQLCENNLDAKVGLGFARLRQGLAASAESLFTVVIRRDATNADGWHGLTLARWRLGDRNATLEVALKAIRLNPTNTAIRDILKQLDPDWERETGDRFVRPDELRVDARARGDYFEIPDSAGRWSRFYVKGVNIGAAMPGKFPSEFPTDSATYAGWLERIAAMHANTVRVYTILPPPFYRALLAWNTRHPDQALWLIHGVWTELPPGHDFEDVPWKQQFRQEMHYVVDLVHGSALIPVRPGHASGLYDADVSRWTLGYIIGREWEPFAVKEFESRSRRARTDWRGRFLEARRALHMDAWMAELCDYLLVHEVDRYSTIRPIAYTNWPTLDPLTHVTESTGEEEMQMRNRLGRPLPSNPLEYENDAIGLDAMLIRPTRQNPAGWFASYHVYPYYPDFMLYDPGYSKARSSEGPSNYFGYLKHLKKHHRGIPLLLSEYGVPSSRGNAHLQPQGWDHGGHDEQAMAAIDARLTREIRESGAAGGIVFAWLDEWFKKNWIVMDYEIPLQNTRQWHNVMDAEQHYGMLGLYAGDSATTPHLGGDPARWSALEPLYRPDTTASDTAPATIRIGSDESWLYLAIEFPGLAGRDFPWPDRQLLLPIDSYRRDLGQHALPGGLLKAELGFEFLAVFRDTSDAELRILPEYSPYVGADAIVDGDNLGRFSRRPVTSVFRDDGRFDSMFVLTNRTRIARNGTMFPATGINRGRLRYGTEAQSTLSDWYWDRTTGRLTLRLGWNLLNVSDPSTATLLFESGPVNYAAEIETARSDGLRVGAVVASRDGTLLATLPAIVEGRWQSRDFPSWDWQTWTTPRYHQALKPVYDSLRAVWGRQ
jgi:hypothetical protein